MNFSKSFDLEQEIMHCWTIVDDIDLLYSQLGERKFSEDELQNYLLGLKTIYQIKFEKLFGTYESYMEENRKKLHPREF